MIVLIILTFVSLVILNIGLFADKENVKNTGIIMMVFVIVGGWLVFGFSADVKQITYKTSIKSMVKEDYQIKVSDTLDNTYSFTRKVDFDNITDTTTFYVLRNSNIYGFSREYKMFYKIKDVKFYSDFSE